MSIYINHLGFAPGAAKHFLLGGPTELPFVVRDQPSGNVACAGTLRRVASDFGLYVHGEFTKLRQPGTYCIQAGRERSEPFIISTSIHDTALGQMVNYFTLQRCGDSERNWLGRPCHLDDGIRGDTRAHLDVSGGWHDACDLRKWVGATIFGLLGLLRLKTVLNPAWDTGQIEDELRWGNRYFLNMQDPAGFAMNYCGGDYFVHADNNRWTDNLGDGRDDRLIDTRPADTTTQWLFVLAQAGIARLTAQRDPAYSQTCRQAGQRCLNWLIAEPRTRAAGELGVALSALVELHQCDADDAHLDRAVGYAAKLIALQVQRQEDTDRLPVWGFFWDRREPGDVPMTLEPYRSIWQGCWPLLGLSDLLAQLPHHGEAPRWHDAISLFCERYLLAMAGRNAFGIIPYGLYRTNPGGGRRLGKFWYRWFYEDNPSWCVGINANLAASGAGLLRAARIMQQPQWADAAQRQLDWVLGVNPFDACTVVGLGRNNPQHMFGLEFDPPTPLLPGAVMNGISGDGDDQPRLRPGAYQECEYWTPMVAFTMWLMGEAQSGH